MIELFVDNYGYLVLKEYIQDLFDDKIKHYTVLNYRREKDKEEFRPFEDGYYKIVRN